MYHRTSIYSRLTKAGPAALAVLLAFSTVGCNLPPEDEIENSSDKEIELDTGEQALTSGQSRRRVNSWRVKHQQDESIVATGVDSLDSSMARIEVRKKGDLYVIAVGAEELVLNQKGVVVKNTLTEKSRPILADLQVAANRYKAPYGWVACGASIGAVIGASVSCAFTIGTCVAVPFAFCAGSQYCGNDVCGTGGES